MIRQWLLSSFAGLPLLRLRDRLALITAGREQAGMVANDQLAGLLVARLLDPGGIFVDVGAHIGSVSAAVRRNVPDARIVAVEAVPGKAVRLQRAFPGIRVESCALGEREGRTNFFVDPDRSAYSSLAQRDGRQHAIEVPMRTLDAVVGDDRVDLLKIDVEGAELGVLLGGSAVLARCRPVVLFESGADTVLGYRKEAMWRFLSERDYGVFLPGRLAHEAPPLGLETFLDSHLYPRRSTNYFAVPLEHVSDIRDKARRIMNIRAA